jgi:hypothetical protein
MEKMTDVAQGQVAFVIGSLERECKFDQDDEEYIVVVAPYVTTCQHVQDWGWAIYWYLEDGTLHVGAEESQRIRLMPLEPE